MVRRVAVFVVVALLVAQLVAQESNLQFEVASIRRNESGRLQAPITPRVLPGGRFGATLATVESLLTFAYELKSYQVVGGPEWVRDHWFEINAKAPGDASADEIRLMVRSLLSDRFSLVTHVEPRTMKVLALVRADPDGPLGASLTPIDECSPRVLNELRRTSPEKYPTPGGGGMMSGCSSMGLGRLADLLSSVENVPVIDATGLNSSFHYVIRSRATVVGAFLGTNNRNPNLPSLSTALNEQLGLKLESRNARFDARVIDSVQAPTEN